MTPRDIVQSPERSRYGFRLLPTPRWWARILAVVAFLAWGAVTARLFVWPDLPPLPDRVDAIVELGGPGNRDDLALALAEQGRARYLVQSTSDYAMRNGWCQPPVANVTVRCFHPDPFTTRGEARAIAAMAKEYGWQSIILVTTPDQAWRATVRVGRCFDGEIFVATATLQWYKWPFEVVEEWGATAKAFTYETSC
jgi:hypothetical protein